MLAKPWVFQAIIAGFLTIFVGLSIAINFVIMAQYKVSALSTEITTKYYLWYYKFSEVPSEVYDNHHFTYSPSAIVASRVMLIMTTVFGALALVSMLPVLIAQVKASQQGDGHEQAPITRGLAISVITSFSCILLATVLLIAMTITFSVYFFTNNNGEATNGVLFMTWIAEWKIGLRMCIVTIAIGGAISFIFIFALYFALQKKGNNANVDSAPDPLQSGGQPLMYPSAEQPPAGYAAYPQSNCQQPAYGMPQAYAAPPVYGGQQSYGAPPQEAYVGHVTYNNYFPQENTAPTQQPYPNAKPGYSY